MLLYLKVYGPIIHLIYNQRISLLCYEIKKKYLYDNVPLNKVSVRPEYSSLFGNGSLDRNDSRLNKYIVTRTGVIVEGLIIMICRSYDNLYRKMLSLHCTHGPVCRRTYLQCSLLTKQSLY